MKTLKRTKLSDGSHEVMEYSHHTVAADETGFVVLAADETDHANCIDWTETREEAEASREEQSWVETSDENWAACQ